jgi:quinol monooxygenase YgiN
MVVVTLRIKTASTHRAEIVELIQPIVGPTETQPDCLLCRLYSETDDDDALVLLQEWQSQEGLYKFIRSRDFKRVLAAMDLASRPPEISFNTVSSKQGYELIEKLLLGSKGNNIN